MAITEQTSPKDTNASSLSDWVVLNEQVWLSRERRVQELVAVPIGRFSDNRKNGQADPVIDFLFEYYALRPKHLSDWSPGHGVLLLGRSAERFERRKYFLRMDQDHVGLDPSLFPRRRLRSVRWIRDLLVSTSERPPFLGCNGMHEWAMVYGTAAIRHAAIPLRYDRATINSIVEGNAIVCTHFDAFRFFADEARPKNVYQPTFDRMTELEQPGCLHANMDLYRWAGKLYPWIASDLLADTFLLALRIREVDMRASPYDMSAYGLSPIAIETSEGKAEYRSYQQQFYEEGVSLRTRLIESVDSLASWLETAGIGE